MKANRLERSQAENIEAHTVITASSYIGKHRGLVFRRNSGNFQVVWLESLPVKRAI